MPSSGGVRGAEWRPPGPSTPLCRSGTREGTSGARWPQTPLGSACLGVSARRSARALDLDLDLGLDLDLACAHI